jgi:hypothetical protein
MVVTRLLHDALLAWERMPGAEHTARDYEAQAVAVAGQLGITATALRIRIACNRATMPPRDAIDAATADHT